MKWSLSTLVALWTALAIAAAMAGYAVYENVSMPERPLEQLMLEHGWHVMALGAVVYAVLWVGLQRILVRPITLIGGHLYRVGAGQARPLELASRVREVDELVSRVNLMVRRMRQGHDETAIDTADEDLRALRDLARSVHEVAPDRSEQMLLRANRLQHALAALIQH